MKDAPVFALLSAAGLAIALAIAGTAGKPHAEAWDARLYWSVGIPSMALLAGAAGYLRPHRSWAWGFAVVSGTVAQIAWVTIRRGEIATLWPVGLLFAAAIALGCGAVARVGSVLRRQVRNRRA